MVFIINIVILVVQILYFIKKVLSFKKEYMDFSAIFYFIYCFFYIPVFWDMFLQTNIFKYVYKIVSEYNIEALPETLTFYNFISLLIIMGFGFGYDLYKNKENKNINYIYIENYYILIQISLFGFWLLLETIAFKTYDKGLLLFLLPSSKKIYNSAYVKYLTIAVPLVMFTLRTIKDLYKYGKIKKGIILNIIIVIITVIPAGQRREIIEAFLYMAMIILFSNVTIEKQLYKKMIKLLIVSLIFVAVFWYARVYFFQFQKNRSTLGNPFSTRKPIEVVYGSGATGFPTSIAIHNFYNERHLPYGRNIIYVFTNIIPRSLYENKLSALTEEIQQVSNTNSNLSLFYVSDMYFTFGMLSPFFSLFFGYFFSRLYKNSLKGSLRKKYLSYFMFSKIILLFKNGFSEYIIMMVFYVVLLEIAINIVFPRGDNLNEKNSYYR